MERDIVISEVLCFVSNNYDKIITSDMKPIIVNFYSDDELCRAKDILLKAVTKALDDVGRASELPRIPKRVGEHKIKHNAEDLLKLFTIADEQKLLMPHFVASDLLRIPFVDAGSMNMVSMIQKLDSFERRLAAMENCYIHDMTSEPSGATSLVPDDVSVHISGGDSTSQSLLVGGSTADATPLDGGSDTTVSWSTVTRRHRPAQVRKAQAAAPAQKSHDGDHKKKSKLYGTARSSDSVIKSGVEIVHKSVVHVDNLDSNCTPELLKDYLLSKDVTVLTCYPTKSWLRDDEKDKVTAFRVCVPADQRNAIMNANIWSDGIVLRDWKFKGKHSPQNGAQHQS